MHHFSAAPKDRVPSLGRLILWAGVAHWKHACRQAHIEGSLRPGGWGGDAGTCFALTRLLLPAAEGPIYLQGQVEK